MLNPSLLANIRVLPTEVKFPHKVKSCRKLPALGRCIGVKRSHDMQLNRSASCSLSLCTFLLSQTPSASFRKRKRNSNLSQSLFMRDFKQAADKIVFYISDRLNSFINGLTTVVKALCTILVSIDLIETPRNCIFQRSCVGWKFGHWRKATVMLL